jgi:hypothetical protein
VPGVDTTPDDTRFASTVKVSFDSASASRFFRRITAGYITSVMKKLFVLSMFLSFAMICSCQKQDSATEAQVAQRKAELDSREQGLNGREKELALKETVLNERARALAQKEKAIGSAPTITPDAQSGGQVMDPAQLKALRDQLTDPAQLKALRDQVTDPAQMKARREKVLQQLPPEVRALIPDPAQVQAQRDRITQQALDQRQRFQELQRTQPQMQNQDTTTAAGQLGNAAGMQNQAASPATTAAPAAVYPGAEATSPPQLVPLSVYPQPEATSPSPSPTPQ